GTTTVTVVLGAMAVAACSGSTSSNTPGESSSCTVTLTGAVTGTYNCKPAITVWASSNNQGGFTFQVPQAGTTPQITLAIGFSGEPHSGTYSNTTAGTSGGATITTGSGGSAQYWIASSGSGSAIGSYSLVFTSVSNAASSANGKVYQGEGTVDATLPSAGSAAAVTLHATF